jgi:mRNA interferase MazF
MKKDFEGWNKKKQDIDSSSTTPFYHQREVWWCSLGVNVGSEQDGTGLNYDRPVLIIRGFNQHMFFGVPLTGKQKAGKYYFPLGKISDRDATAILSQALPIDTKRLIRKTGTINEAFFKDVCKALKKTLFG